jgi:uroporphyrinogen decarboxylase
MITNPPFAEFIFEKVGWIVSGLFGKLAKHSAVGAIWLSSDIAFGTSLMVSPESLRKYVFPWIKKIADIAHQSDLPMIFHSDGNLTEVIGDLIEAGIDALHPIEPQAMDIKVVRNKYGPRLSLVGNVDVDILISRNPDDVRKEAGRLRELFGDQGGYILGSGNSIPAAVPIENYKALIEP